MAIVALGTESLSLTQLVALSRAGTQAALAPEAIAAVERSRRVVEAAVASGRTVYGVNTGFGKLASQRIPSDMLATLQRNLLLSHATGVGEPLSFEVSKLAFALRIQALARGRSGVRRELLETMLALYCADRIPVIPSLGSVGASGDLAPLAHMALPLIGEGFVHGEDGPVSGAAALQALGLAPVALVEKEGLALINGTQIMTAIGLLALAQAELLVKAGDIACATTVEALRGSARPFLARIHELRPHEGQRRAAANLRALLQASEIAASHADCGRIQDAYSLRCAPQVHGATKDAFEYARRVLCTEAISVTDNPLVFDDGDVVSGGNFHGQPVSQACDVLAIGMTTLANVSERRIENLVNPDISGLPPFLAPHPGIESGFMIPQVVAAALCSENKTLAHPKSVDTIPTSANREDHVSMGVTAARHLALVVDNVRRVLAIELMCAAQGLDCGEALRPGRGVAVAYEVVREVVATLTEDRILSPDIAAIERVIANGELVRRVEAVVGELL
jgi:histidine ammonia-lyase